MPAVLRLAILFNKRLVLATNLGARVRDRCGVFKRPHRTQDKKPTCGGNNPNSVRHGCCMAPATLVMGSEMIRYTPALLLVHRATGVPLRVRMKINARSMPSNTVLAVVNI